MVIMSRGLNFLVFLTIGIFILLEVNAFKYIEKAKVDAEVRVFLKESADTDYLKREIEKETGVEKALYLSEEYAMQEFKEEFELTEPMGRFDLLANPLPASFRVVLNPKYKNPEYLSCFSKRVSALDGIESIVYGKEYIQTISTINKYFTWLSYGMGGLLFFLTLLTLNTSLNHRSLVMKNETSFLRSVGVSKWKLKLRLSGRALFENIILSGIAIGLIYFDYRLSISRFAEQFYNWICWWVWDINIYYLADKKDLKEERCKIWLI